MFADEKIKALEERIKRLEELVDKLVGKDSFADSENLSPVLASYDFSKPECRDCSGWKLFNAERLNCDDALAFRTVQLERTIGVVYNPQLVFSPLEIPCEKIRRAHIKLKANGEADKKYMLRVYFATDKNDEFTKSCSVFYYYQSGQTVDAYIDVKSRNCSGILTGIRIDLVDEQCQSIELELVEILGADGCAVFATDFTGISDFSETGWKLINASNVTCNGRLVFDVDEIEKKKIYNDPFMRIDNLHINADLAKYIHIKLHTEIETKNQEDVYMQLLFKTEASNFWTQDKSMRYNYEAGKDIDAYVEVKQLFWKGDLVALRIDPFEKFEGSVEIKLVELLREIPKNADVQILKARMNKLEDRFNRTYK